MKLSNWKRGMKVLKEHVLDQFKDVLGLKEINKVDKKIR